MRNLNGREFSGRALRVDNAASEKNKEELKSKYALQCTINHNGKCSLLTAMESMHCSIIHNGKYLLQCTINYMDQVDIHSNNSILT